MGETNDLDNQMRAERYELGPAPFEVGDLVMLAQEGKTPKLAQKMDGTLQNLQTSWSFILDPGATTWSPDTSGTKGRSSQDVSTESGILEEIV